jgi:hypothetical protein
MGHTLSAVVLVLIAVIICKSLDKFLNDPSISPDQCGDWVSEVVLCGRDYELVLYRQRYKTAVDADAHGTKICGKIHGFFKKALPYDSVRSVFQTKNHGEVFLSVRTDGVAREYHGNITATDLRNVAQCV